MVERRLAPEQPLLPHAEKRTDDSYHRRAIATLEALSVIERTHVVGVVWRGEDVRGKIPADLFDAESGLVYAEVFARIRRSLRLGRGVYDAHGFDRNGIHKSTLLPWDRAGFDAQGFHREVGRNRRGFDHTRVNRITCSLYDKRGFDFDGRHRNGTEYDDAGFTVDCMHRETQAACDPEGYDSEGYNARGFARDGYNKRARNQYGVLQNGYSVTGYGPDGFNRSGYDRDYYDREGYNRRGYDRKRIDREGYNDEGIDADGFDRNWKYMGFRNHDNYGFTYEALHIITGTRFDLNGFDRSGLHRDTGTHFDAEMHNRDGSREQWVSFDAFDTDGIHGITQTRFDENGFDCAGLHRDTGTCSDPEMHDRGGWKTTWCPPLGFDVKLRSDRRDFNEYHINAETKSPYSDYGLDYYENYPPRNDLRPYSPMLPF